MMCFLTLCYSGILYIMNTFEKIKRIISDETLNTISLNKSGSRRATVIAFCSQKGGVGKTTSAINVGAALADFHDKKVLIVDLDPQGHVEKSLSAMIDQGLEYETLSTIFLSKNGQLSNGIVRTKSKNLSLTPGDKSLYETEGMLATKLGREHILARALKSATTHYDYVIIDCPPNLGNLTINALCAADHVLIPCEMSVLAFEGVSDLLETFDLITERLNKKLKILGVVFTRVDGRNAQMNELVKENMRKLFKGKIFKTEITINTDLNKSQLEGVPVFDFAASSSGAKNYKNLADEVLALTTGRALKKSKSKRSDMI